ncbi:hypothetical protein HOP52_07445 [Halomonas campisalis]|uniref:Uncharacterized protein n=1 Tax=Billgrantia campisalis TaxID=74661 RepID=A0ABS9P7K8_9GAMM|nr:hypothetical protein [Halomonas campisalis]MCG6657596.1 hypothetical protein [Halomonas campisalis]MDR5862631.1 hypothetical protein [Halomonas campisalis]
MTTAQRLTITALAGAGVMAAAMTVRAIAGLEPFIAHGLTSPVFFGACAALIAWVITRSRE